MRRQRPSGWVVASVLLLATGCGSRMSAEEIEEKFNTGIGPLAAAAAREDDETTRCLAEVMHDSNLSDEALVAMVNGQMDFAGDEGDTLAVYELKVEWEKCKM